MFKDSLLDDLFPIWYSVQTDLAKVLRWDIYIDKDETLRKQSTLQHQYSICFVLIPVLLKLKAHYPALDSEFMKDAFLLHDIPEGLLKMKSDVIEAEKNQSHDLMEYKVFVKDFEKLGIGIFNYMHRAYLLQFAHKKDEELIMFPDEAMGIITYFRSRMPYEVQSFKAIERWEYIFYAYEAYLHNNNPFLIVNVLRSQVPHLQCYAKELKGFNTIFTPEVERRVIKFMEYHRDIPKPTR